MLTFNINSGVSTVRPKEINARELLAIGVQILFTLLATLFFDLFITLAHIPWSH